MAGRTTRSNTLSSQTIPNVNPKSYRRIKKNNYSERALELMLASVDSTEFMTEIQSFAGASCDAKMGRQVECDLNCHNPECANVKIQIGRSTPKALIVHMSEKKGHIILAGEDFKPGDFICEYLGAVITPEENIDNFRSGKTSRMYAFNFGNPYTDLKLKIDAEKEGNVARFIAHSCLPTAEAQVWVLPNSEIVIGIYSMAIIKKNHEITISYGETYKEFNVACECGSPVCRGIIC